MPNNHLIGRQKFKIRVTTRADADFIYANISELAKGQLTREIEKILNERYDEQAIIRIDRLVLELGALDRQQFAQRLIEEVTNQLRVALPEVPSPDQKISAEVSALELVDFYLLRGYFPWRYQQQAGRGLAELIEQLLATTPDRLFKLLQLRLKKLINQKRLAYQLPEKTFNQLNQRAWAAEWPSIKDRMNAIVANHQSDLKEMGYPPSLFKKIGYLAALMAGLAPSNSRVLPREKFELLFAKHFGAFFKPFIEAKSSATPPRQAVLANFIQFLKSGDTDPLNKARSYNETTVSSLLNEEAPSLMRFLRLLPNEEQDFIEAVLSRMSTVLGIDLIVATFLRLGYLTDASVMPVSELARQLKFNAAKLTEDQQQSTDRHDENDSRDKGKTRLTDPSRSAKEKKPTEASQTLPDQPSKSSSEGTEPTDLKPEAAHQEQKERSEAINEDRLPASQAQEEIEPGASEKDQLPHREQLDPDGTPLETQPQKTGSEEPNQSNQHKENPFSEHLESDAQTSAAAESDQKKEKDKSAARWDDNRKHQLLFSFLRAFLLNQEPQLSRGEMEEVKKLFTKQAPKHSDLIDHFFIQLGQRDIKEILSAVERIHRQFGSQPIQLYLKRSGQRDLATASRPESLAKAIVLARQSAKKAGKTVIDFFETPANLRKPAASSDSASDADKDKLSATNSQSDERERRLAVVLNYLSTGRLNWEKQQYTHSAVLGWLEQMLDNQDRDFFKRLLKELKQARTNTFIHQQLDWPLLLKLQRWLWKEISDQPFDYDQDLQFLLGKLNLSTYSIDLIRRDAFRHWTKARLLSENGSLAWSALFPAIFSRAAREKGQDDEQFLLAINRIVEATAADKWTSDLPEIIKSLTAPLLNEFSATRNPGAIALLRFYLQNGYLPASATSKKLADIEDDLRLRIQQREPTLLVTLGQMLQSSTANKRFQSGLSLGLQFDLASWLVETASSSRTAKTGERAAETDPVATESSTEASEQAGALASSEAPIYWPTFLAELPNWVQLLRPPADQNESNTTTSTEQPGRRSENDLLAKGYTFICLAILVKGMAKSSAVEILLTWIKSTGNKYAFQLSDPGLPPETSTTPPETQATDTLKSGDQLSVPPADPSVEWATYARHLLHRRAVKKTASTTTKFKPATRLALEQIARLAPDNPAAGSSKLSEISPATLKTSPQTSGKIKSAPDKETKKSALLQAYWLTLFNTGKSLDPDSLGIAGEMSIELGDPLDGMRELLDAPSAVWQQWLGQLSGSSAQVNRIDDLLTAELARRFKERILLDFNPATETLLEELALLLRRADLYPSPEAARRRVRFHAISYILAQPEATYNKLTATLLLRLSREKQLSLRELAEKVSRYLAGNGLKTTELTTTLLLESRRIEAAEKTVIQQKNDLFIEEVKQLSKSELAAIRGRELLLHLLQSGTTPWWEEEQETIDFHFRTASQNDAPEMGRLLEKSPELLDKLLPFLAPSSLEDFSAKLFPAYGDFIRAYLLSAELLHRELNRSFDWSAFLSAIMKLRTFDSNQFVRSEVIRLAPLASEALVREQLLASSREQSAKGDLRFFRLSTILSELAGATTDVEVAAETAPASKSPETARAPQAPQKPPAIETDEAALINKPSAAARELDARLELIRHFLVYGTLPTDADKHWSRTALQELQEQFINNYPEIALSFYRRLLRLSYVRSRVIRHFTPSFWSDLTGLLIGQKAARDVYLIWDDLWRLSPEWLPKKSGQFDKKELRIHLLAYAAAGPATFSLVDYLLKLLQLIAARLNLREEEIFVALREKVALRADELKQDWQLLLDNYQRRKTQEQMDSDEIEVNELNDAIFISNSGLVILAPFLPRYFDVLGMVKDRAFVDEQAAIRAVQLLQYLVSGQSETEEYLLVLNKLLCGLPISTPIPSSIELSEQELETSRQLLNAVLQNWDKMSNSSVDNLRGSFLLRDGRLDESDDKWQLIVESAGYDVILSFLPWTISVISLPWMEKQLYVDWSTQIS